MSDLETILSVLKAVSSPWIGVCIDVNHLNLYMTPEEGIKKAGKLLGEVHCSDNHGQKEEHLLIGDGIINWAAVGNALQSIDFDGYIILETNNCYKDLSDAQFLSIAATKIKTIL